MTAPTSDLHALPHVVPLWPTVGPLFGLGRDSTYRLARSGRFPVPVLHLGRKLVVTRASLLAVLGPIPGAALAHGVSSQVSGLTRDQHSDAAAP